MKKGTGPDADASAHSAPALGSSEAQAGRGRCARGAATAMEAVGALLASSGSSSGGSSSSSGGHFIPLHTVDVRSFTFVLTVMYFVLLVASAIQLARIVYRR